MKMMSVLIMITAALFIPFCVEQTTSENKEATLLTGLEKTLPESRHCIKIHKVNTVKIPVGLTEPEQAILIYKDKQSPSADTLSILLFFYKVAQKSVIDSIIKKSAVSYSGNTPVAFAESAEYYVLTSPGNVHSSSVFEEGMEVESVMSLVKEYIENRQA